MAALPSLGSPPVVVRFAPGLYRLRVPPANTPLPTPAAPGATPPPASGGGQQQGVQEATDAAASGGSHGCWARGLPYRMVFAVATLHSVLVYDTQVWLAGTRQGGLWVAACGLLAGSLPRSLRNAECTVSQSCLRITSHACSRSCLPHAQLLSNDDDVRNDELVQLKISTVASFGLAVGHTVLSMHCIASCGEAKTGHCASSVCCDLCCVKGY
jgi:hypothetical protein